MLAVAAFAALNTAPTAGHSFAKAPQRRRLESYACQVAWEMPETKRPPAVRPCRYRWVAPKNVGGMNATARTSSRDTHAINALARAGTARNGAVDPAWRFPPNREASACQDTHRRATRAGGVRHASTFWNAASRRRSPACWPRCAAGNTRWDGWRNCWTTVWPRLLVDSLVVILTTPQSCHAVSAERIAWVVIASAHSKRPWQQVVTHSYTVTHMRDERTARHTDTQTHRHTDTQPHN